MDKDTLRAIEIIYDILGELERNLKINARFGDARDFLNAKRQDLYEIINNNKNQ